MELTKSDNWYTYLGLSPEAATEEIQSAVERLSRQASALAATSPERSQLMRETIRAIKRDLLSGPENRRLYDAQRAAPQAPAPTFRPAPVPVPPAAGPAPPGSSPYPPSAYPPPPGQGAGSRLARFLKTGWTCPSCGKGGVPSDKFCTKCGTPIQLMQPEPARPSRVRPACASCGGPLAAADAFCSMCGARR